MSTFKFTQGTIPILVSMPHNGIQIPADIASKMTSSALKVVDTDWYLDRLYQFAQEQGCYMISPIYNRYVIDLNRSNENVNLYPGQDTTELCPTSQFNKQPIYLNGKEPSETEIEDRIEKYWKPYHQQLQLTLKQMKERFGVALLFEAHSIKSVVPRFFEGQLADFNFGNNDGKSCSDEFIQALVNWNMADYSKVINGRFKGGFITREYSDPKSNIHTLQLELSQATYLDEVSLNYHEEKAELVQVKLRELIKLFNDVILKLS